MLNLRQGELWHLTSTKKKLPIIDPVVETVEMVILAVDEVRTSVEEE